MFKKCVSIILALMMVLSLTIVGATTAAAEGEDTYVVAGAPADIFGNAWSGTDPNNAMELNGDVYSKTYTADKAFTGVQLKVVKNGETWIGDANGDNITFNLTDAGDFTVTFDPNTSAISVTGNNVEFPTGFEYEAVYAVGNGGGTWLNGIEWNPGAEANIMTETSDDVWEIDLSKAAEDEDELQIKFAVDGSWTHNFGIAEGGVFTAGEWTDAKYNGNNITIALPEDSVAAITATLDLTGFDFESKTGAKFKVDVEIAGDEPTEAPTEAPTETPTDEPIVGAPAFYAIGTFSNWEINDAFKLTKNTEAGTEEYCLESLSLTTDDQFKVVSYNASILGGDQTWYPTGTGNNYGQNGEITEAGTYNLYFRPNYDGGEDWFYNCIFVEAPAVEPTDAPTDAPTEAPTEAPTDAPTEAPTGEVGTDTYVVAGAPGAIFGNEWSGADPNNAMEPNGDVYSKTYTVEEAFENVQLKVVKNGETWIGDATGNNFTFNLTGAGSFTVTIDPATNAVTITGDIVEFPTSFEYEAVYAVGNGGGTWLNGIEWNPGAEANIMTETSDDVWEIDLSKAAEDEDELQIKFAVDGSWTHNFGIGEGSVFTAGEWIDAAYNGNNITIAVEANSAWDIKAVLDLTGFNFETKTGAKFCITMTPAEEGETRLVGDVDGDGDVDNRDAMILDRYVAGWEGYADRIANPDSADLNRDTDINNRDAMILDRVVAGWEGYYDTYVIKVAA